MSIEEMFNEVIGYSNHYNRIDAETVREHPLECGHTCEYYGFKKDNTYRCFAVCKKCDVAEEF